MFHNQNRLQKNKNNYKIICFNKGVYLRIIFSQYPEQLERENLNGDDEI